MKADFLFIENLISGMLPFVLLLLCGAYLTVKTGFFQIRLLPASIKYALGGIFEKRDNNGGVSPFQAACTALSATVGTGNIAGVAGAVSVGGAGAVFWMWISAFTGMTVKAAEIVLSLEYREKKENGFAGGPMYYIKNGLSGGFKILSPIFAALCIPAVFLSGNMTQINAAVTSVSDSFCARLILGIAFSFIAALVIIGGAKRIAVFTEKIVPFMALLYMLLTLCLIAVNYKRIPMAFGMIFEGAFNPRAVTGGIVGSVFSSVTAGASRGVFSNEAGLGTSAMAHSSAEKNDGARQSLYGIFEVFADTVVICTLTALTFLVSGVNIDYGTVASTELAVLSLSSLYGDAAKIMLGIMMCLFGISSVIGWGLYGIVSSGFVFGKKGERAFVLLYPIFCIMGAVISADTVWRLSAFFNGLMLCVNVFAVLLLSDKAIVPMRELLSAERKR